LEIQYECRFVGEKWPPTGYLAKHQKSKHAQRREWISHISMTLLFCLTQYYHPLGNGQISASKHGASRAQILWFLTVVVLAAMHYAVIPSRALQSTQYMIINHICYLKSPLSMGLVQSNLFHADHTELSHAVGNQATTIGTVHEPPSFYRAS